MPGISGVSVFFFDRSAFDAKFSASFFGLFVEILHAVFLGNILKFL